MFTHWHRFRWSGLSCLFPPVSCWPISRIGLACYPVVGQPVAPDRIICTRPGSPSCGRSTGSAGSSGSSWPEHPGWHCTILPGQGSLATPGAGPNRQMDRQYREVRHNERWQRLVLEVQGAETAQTRHQDLSGRLLVYVPVELSGKGSRERWWRLPADGTCTSHQ